MVGPGRLEFAASLILAVALLGVAASEAEPSAPFDYFRALSPARLATIDVQLTYIGARRRAFPSVSFSTTGAVTDPETLKVALRVGYGYGRWESGRLASALSLAELAALIDSVGDLPDVTAGDVDSVGLFSFALLDTAGGSRHVFEAILNETSGLELVERMAATLKGNARAAEVLACIACGLRTTPAGAASDVTGSVTVALGRFATDPMTRRVRLVARIVNRTRAPLPAPLVLVVDARPGTVRLVGADGHTCRVFRPGSPFVFLSIEGALAPGQAVERSLEFDNPRQESFEIERKVFSGWGR